MDRSLLVPLSRRRPQFAALLVLVFALPLPLGSNRPWLWPLAAAVLCVVAATLAAAAARGELRASPALLRARRALALLAAWLLFGLVQLLPLVPGDGGLRPISVEPARSLLSWFESLFLVLLFTLCLQLTDTRERLRMLMATVILAGLLQAAWGSFMTLSGLEWNLLGPKTTGRGLATGTFVNRNHLAGFLELCLAVGLGRLIAELGDGRSPGSLRAWLRDRTRALLGPGMRVRLALLVMVIGLVLSRSRMGNAAFFGALLLAGSLALVLLRRPPRALVLLLASLLVIDLAVIGTWFGVEQVVERIQETGAYDPATGRLHDEDRFDVDAEALAAWRAAPWFGHGGGTFYTVFPRYRPADVGRYFDHAHNDYLEFLVEYGLLGAILPALFWAWSLATALWAMRRRRHPLLRGAAFAVLMGSCAYLIHSTVDFNLHIPANSAYFMLLLALAWLAAGLPAGASGAARREGAAGRSQAVEIKSANRHNP